jgi:ABC-type uncharacterized transport system substrate-binding protein
MRRCQLISLIGGAVAYPLVAKVQAPTRNGADYADRILRGANPADPIQFPTKFDLVINAATADALGLIVAPDLLVDAELIE